MINAIQPCYDMNLQDGGICVICSPTDRGCDEWNMHDKTWTFKKAPEDMQDDSLFPSEYCNKPSVKYKTKEICLVKSAKKGISDTDSVKIYKLLEVMQ